MAWVAIIKEKCQNKWIASKLSAPSFSLKQTSGNFFEAFVGAAESGEKVAQSV
jgi:hypothetical protein